MPIPVTHYLTLGAILFTTGVFGIFLNRKNVIVILMSIELTPAPAQAGIYLHRQLEREHSSKYRP